MVGQVPLSAREASDLKGYAARASPETPDSASGSKPLEPWYGGSKTRRSQLAEIYRYYETLFLMDHNASYPSTSQRGPKKGKVRT